MRLLQIIIFSLLSSSIMFGQGSKIYCFEADTSNPGREIIISYDYLTDIKDTVFSNPAHSWNGGSFRNTIDPFGGRYFFLDESPPQTGVKLYSFDLNNHSLRLLAVLPSRIYNLEYDMFSNSIIYMEMGCIKKIDLNTSKIDTLATVTNFNSIIWGVNRGYDPFKQEYIYMSYTNSIAHLYVFDIRKNSLIDSTLIQIGSNFDGLKYDLVSKEYFAIGNDGYVLKVNPHPFKMEFIFQIKDFYGQLNSQQPVFDPTTGYYILPYLNKSKKCRLAVIDVVNKKSVKNISFIRRSNAHELYSMYSSSLRWDGSRLTATFGNTYTWYRNESKIEVKDQSYFPDEAGSYRVFVEFPQYSSFTNEIIVDSAMISHVKSSQYDLLQGIKIFPNPSQGNFWIQMVKQSEVITVEIYSVFGNLVRKWEVVSSTENVTVESMSPGVYVLKASSANNVFTAKVVVVE